MKSTKTMLIAALAAGALLACSSVLPAQDTPNTPPAGGMKGRMMGPTIEQLTTNLSLTAEEIPKVKAVLDEQKKKMADLRADQSVQGQDRRTKMQEIRADVTAKMKEILTPDQFTKYQTMTQRNRRPAGSGTPPAAPPQA